MFEKTYRSKFVHLASDIFWREYPLRVVRMEQGNTCWHDMTDDGAVN
ncbi:MAG: hypothetical protein ACRCT9_11675 [Roseinatronobacter monicus]